MIKKLILGALILMVSSGYVYAANPTRDPSGLTTGKPSDTPDVTYTAGCIHGRATLEIDGATRLDSTVDINGATDIAGAITHSSGHMIVTESTTHSAVRASSTIAITAEVEILVATGTITSTADPLISTNTSTYPAGSRVTIRVSSSAAYGGNAITFNDTTGLDLWGANKTLNVGDEMDLKLYQVPNGAMEWHLQAIRDAAGDWIGANEEIISNGTNGTIDITGNLTTSGITTIPSGGTFTIAAGAVVNSTWAITLNVTGSDGVTAVYNLDAATMTSSSWMRCGGVFTATDMITASKGIYTSTITTTGNAVVGGTLSSTDMITGSKGIYTSTITTTGNIVAGGTLSLTNDATLTSSMSVSGMYIQVDANADGDPTHYGPIIVSTSLAFGEEYTLYRADARAGWFEVIMGTHNATGSFTDAGVVTLSAISTANNCTTTNGQAGNLNVYDGGTVVIVENANAPTTTAYIRYGFVKP